jgi:signal transduction histidine kinase
MESNQKQDRRDNLVAERLRSRKLVEKSRQLRASLENQLALQSQRLINLQGTITKREMNFNSSRGRKRPTSVERALANISRKLIEAQEQERARIARELHDDINQRLALLAVGIDGMHKDVVGPLGEVRKRVSELTKQTTEISTAIQDLAHELHSSSLEYLGFVSALKKLAGELNKRQEMQIEIKNDGVPNKLPPEMALCLYRVVQEALHNAVKHSGAKHVAVHLAQTADQIQITLRDSGKGFDLGAVNTGQGLGLASMRERIRLVHGTLVIRSEPMAGTSVRACVPFPAVVLPTVGNC